MYKKLLLAALLVTTMATPALARVAVDIGVNLAPPVEREEFVPAAPAPNMVWMPGYWTWNGYQYVWAPGRYIAERPGYFWVADEWVHVGNGWRRAPGHWERQRFPDHNRDWHGPDEHWEHR